MDEFEFGDNEEGQCTLVYDNIIKSKGLMPVTRTLAVDLSESGYMSVGDFLKSLILGVATIYTTPKSS